ncbi:MAG: hypothetical protein HKN22_01310 [Bacteroidia bacterium]|nr:hypothetical protein [Bacteroidia bacterium]
MNIRSLNNKLRSNYLILSKLVENGCNRVPENVLHSLNFDPKVVTYFDNNNNRKKIYDITFSQLEDGSVSLVKE